MFKGDPGGIVYGREATVGVDFVFDQWHPWEKVIVFVTAFQMLKTEIISGPNHGFLRQTSDTEAGIRRIL